jgi:hypothetical protein
LHQSRIQSLSLKFRLAPAPRKKPSLVTFRLNADLHYTTQLLSLEYHNKTICLRASIQHFRIVSATLLPRPVHRNRPLCPALKQSPGIVYFHYKQRLEQTKKYSTANN